MFFQRLSRHIAFWTPSSASVRGLQFSFWTAVTGEFSNSLTPRLSLGGVSFPPPLPRWLSVWTWLPHMAVLQQTASWLISLNYTCRRSFCTPATDDTRATRFSGETSLVSAPHGVAAFCVDVASAIFWEDDFLHVFPLLRIFLLNVLRC